MKNLYHRFFDWNEGLETAAGTVFSEERSCPMKKTLGVFSLAIAFCLVIAACNYNSNALHGADSAKSAENNNKNTLEQLDPAKTTPLLTTWFGEGDCRVSGVVNVGNEGWMITCIAAVPRQYHYGKLVRIDQGGKILWIRTFSARDLEINSLIAAGDGNYILAGSDSPTPNDRLLSKEERIVLAEDTQTGEQMTFSHDVSANFWMSKVDSSGKEIWVKSFKTDSDDFVCSAIESKNGDLLLAGSTLGSDAGPGYHLMKTNSAGEPIWRKSYAPFDGRLCDAAVATSGGNILMGGTINATRADAARIGLLMVDNDGLPLWSRIYEGTRPGSLTGLSVTTQGNYILAGQSSSAEHGSYAFVKKLDTSGKEIWTRSIDVDVLWDVAATEDGDILATGGGVIWVLSQNGDLIRQIKPVGFKVTGPSKILVLDRSRILLIGSGFNEDRQHPTESRAQAFLMVLKR